MAALWLVAKPKPGEFDERFTGSAVAGAIDTPIAIHAAALKRRWGKIQIAGDLPPVVEGPVEHLPRQDGGEFTPIPRIVQSALAVRLAASCCASRACSRTASSSRIISRVSDSRRRKWFNSATRWVGSGRPSPVLRALMSASPERPGWRATRRCDFRCARAPAPGIPALDAAASRLPLPRSARPRSGKHRDRRQTLPPRREGARQRPAGRFGAAVASGDQDAGRLDNVVDHAVRGQKSMQPKSIPPGLKAADDKRSRVIRRIQPVAQAGDESKQSCPSPASRR